MIHKLNNFMFWLKKVLDRINVVLLGAMFVIILSETFSRVFLNYGIFWAEEISKYILLYIVFFVGIIITYEEGFIKMNFIAQKLKIDKFIDALYLILGLIFYSVMTYGGYYYALFGRNILSPASRIPKIYAYAIIPIGSLLIALSFLLLFIKKYVLKDKSKIRKIKK